MPHKGKLRYKNKSTTVKTKIKKPRGKTLNKWKPLSKAGRLVVKNLPFKVTKDDLEKLFIKFGDINEVKLLKREDGSPLGCGFVQFAVKEHAAEAIKTCNRLDLMGRKINVDWAVPKSDYIVKQTSENAACSKVSEESCNESNVEINVTVPNEVDNIGEVLSSQVISCVSSSVAKKKKMKSQGNKRNLFLPEINNDDENEVADIDTKAEIKSEAEDVVVSNKTSKKRKRKDKKKPAKRGRVIVRNLPFKITEEKLKEHFAQYGEICEVNLLKKPDGKLVGCAFLQFARVQSAAKAIYGSSGKPLLGRTVIIDWAVPQTKYLEATKVKEEPVKEEPNIKEEKIDDDVKSELADDVKSELADDVKSELADDVKSELADEVVQDHELQRSDYTESEDSDESDDEDDMSDVGEESDDEDCKPLSKKPRVISNDVKEGCTVFVKNIPFSATNEDLKLCMEKFGPVFYALVCIDPLTEHSRGTGFVKFKKKESAEECLQSGTELSLSGQILDVQRALDREEIQQRAKGKKEDKTKDSRNLYLVKEGVIMAGSHASIGVSVADMSRRLQLEQWKSQILRNLNMFVSRYRLVVHNVPESWDDTMLRNLFQKEAGKGAIIKEARIMRDLRNVDENGIGKSKGHGFVSFTTHEAALKALRSINNNPTIFSAAKRPIVSFSIENKAILKARQNRLEKSRMKNPLAHNSGKVSNEETQKDAKGKSKKKRKAKESSNVNVVKKIAKADFNQEKTTTTVNGEDGKQFAGVVAEPGNTSLRTRYNLKKQANIHAQNVKQIRKKERRRKKTAAQKQVMKEAIRQPQQKQNVKKKSMDDDQNFSKLINKYKKNLMSINDRKKWYE